MTRYIYNRGEVHTKIPVYVDDITSSAPTAAGADNVVADLAEHFELRDQGHSFFLLGIEITQDRPKRSFSISQRQYIIDMLENYGCTRCTPVQTPMEPGLHPTKKVCPKTDAERAEMSEVAIYQCYGCTWPSALVQTSPTPSPSSAASVPTLANNTGLRSSTSSATSKTP